VYADFIIVNCTGRPDGHGHVHIAECGNASDSMGNGMDDVAAALRFIITV